MIHLFFDNEDIFLSDNIKRIQLLSDTEVEELYARPEFSTNEQALYFTLNKSEQSALQCYANLKTRVHFILQLGYFKATQQFFIFDFEKVRNDTDFILRNYYSESDLTFSGCLSRDYIRKQKQSILDLFNYRDWACEYEAQFNTHICELLKYYPKAHSALRQLLGYFDSQQVVIPTYRKLQDMFTHAFSIEKKRINTVILSIPASKQAILSDLISREDGISQLNITRYIKKCTISSIEADFSAMTVFLIVTLIMIWLTMRSLMTLKNCCKVWLS